MGREPQRVLTRGKAPWISASLRLLHAREHARWKEATARQTSWQFLPLIDSFDHERGCSSSACWVFPLQWPKLGFGGPPLIMTILDLALEKDWIQATPPQSPTVSRLCNQQRHLRKLCGSVSGFSHCFATA